MAKKKRIVLNLLASILFCLSFYLESKESEKVGTLIVTYQTGPKGERLDRIRFWLKEESKEAEMYPKDLNFADDQESMARTVVIENLPLGNYTLHFLIPNKDGFFEEVPPREIAIKSTDSFKIDQKIKPKSN